MVAYRVTGKVISMRNRKTLIDTVTGAPVAFVQKKLIGLRKVYEIYRPTPAFPGQLPGEEDDSPEKLPLYRHSWVQKAIFGGLTNRYSYGVQTAAEKDPIEVLVAQTQFNVNPFKPLMVDVTRPDSETVLATIGKATNFHFRRDASWAVEVSAGMDLLGMLTLAIGVNNIMEDIEDEEENNNHGHHG